MIINSVKAENFRTLVGFSLNFPKNYCAISGKNNAGKSAIIKIIQHFFLDKESDFYFNIYGSDISFQKDSTQWESCDEIEIGIVFSIDSIDDSEVFFVVKTFSELEKDVSRAEIEITHKFYKAGSSSLRCWVEGKELEGHQSSEILKKLRSSSNIIIHNSTNPDRNMYYAGSGSYTEIIEAHFSPEDRKKIEEAQKGVQTRVKRAAKQHKGELENLLGKLKDKYHVELSAVERHRDSRFPLEVKLTDSNVEVPLNDWGAGTQNRTRILMSVMEAARIRAAATAEDRSSPVLLVEEPESFLHPSAQAEFGQILNNLSSELNIQIISTTHSPYMLNQTSPSSNILLERRLFRNNNKETQIVDTSGDDWMKPFSENLGIVPKEFSSWKAVFSSHKDKVILVEGIIDKEYIETFIENYKDICSIPDDVEIIPYNGKDALKNTPILQFMVNKFGRVIVTFDLDARAEVKPSLERIGLEEDKDFVSVGLEGSGKGCIEGLLPAEIMQSVYRRHYDLVTELTGDSRSRNDAKSKLKRHMLEEFKQKLPKSSDLVEFKKLLSKISKMMTGSR